MNTLKAEFRKLLTVRSTYILTILTWLAIAAIAFIVVGLVNSPAKNQNPLLLQNDLFGSLHLAGLIAAIVSILFLAHEYRYNTINYSLTLSNSRSKVFFSKFVAITAYSVVFSLVSVGIAVAGVYAGSLMPGHNIAHQAFNVISPDNAWIGLILQSVFYVWGLALAGLIVTALLRNLVASVAFIFIFPSIESLISLISKTLVSYMPFTALGAVLRLSPLEAGFSAGKSMIIFLVYLVVFTLIAWKLFLKRDAN